MSKIIKLNFVFWASFEKSGIDFSHIDEKATEIRKYIDDEFEVTSIEAGKVTLENKKDFTYLSIDESSIFITIPIVNDEKASENLETLARLVSKVVDAPSMPRIYRNFSFTISCIYFPADEDSSQATMIAAKSFMEKLSNRPTKDILAIDVRVQENNKEARYSVVKNTKSKQYAIRLDVERDFREKKSYTPEDIVSQSGQISSLLHDLEEEHNVATEISKR